MCSSSFYFRPSVLALSFLAFTLGNASPAYSKKSHKKGYEIARHCEKFNQGYKGELSKADMILETSSRKKVSRQLLMKRKENGDQKIQSLLTFVKPVDVKGTKLLTWSAKGKDDQQWIYLKSYRRVKRISSRLKTGSFMGSEFSYEDLGSRSVDKFKHRFLKDGQLKGRTVWILEQKPKDKYSGYSKQIVWMDKKYKSPLQVKYYDRKGELFKEARFEGYRKVGRWWRPRRTVMRNVQTRKKSTLVWKDVKLGKKIASREFQKEYLKN